MKLLPQIAFGFALLLAPTLSKAFEITFTWDPNPPEDQISEYVLYEINGTTQTERIRTPAVTVKLDVQPGIHTYAVAARNLWGESLLSTSVSTPPLPNKPGRLKISLSRSPGEMQIAVSGDPWSKFRVYASEDLERWSLLLEESTLSGELLIIDQAATTGRQRFYKAASL